MIMKGRLAIIVACTGATVFGVLATPSQATTFNLADLVASNSSFTVGDKLFSNFSCSGRSTVIRSGSIDVVTLPYTDCGPVSTIESNPLGLFFNVDLSNASTFRDIIVDIGYTVQTTSGQLIGSVDFDSDVDAGGSAVASISESVFDISNNLLGEAQLISISSFFGQNPRPPVLQQSIILPTPVQLAKVNKTLTVGVGTTGEAFISFTSDRFSQQPSQPVPETSTVPSLVVFGYCGLGLLLKQQQAKNT